MKIIQPYSTKRQAKITTETANNKQAGKNSVDQITHIMQAHGLGIRKQKAFVQKDKNRLMYMLAFAPLAACGGGGGTDASTSDTTNFLAREFDGTTAQGITNGNDLMDYEALTNDLIIYGNGGHDQIFTGSGDDTITTGSGADEIITNAGDDSVSSGAGNDVISTGASSNTGYNIIRAGAGADDITLSDSGRDIIVIVGVTTANQYSVADINLANRGTTGVSDNLSSVMSLSDLNGNTVSDLVSGDVIKAFDVNNDIIHIYGQVDASLLTLPDNAKIYVHSDVTFSVEQIASFEIECSEDSVIRIKKTDSNGQTTVNISKIKGASEVSVEEGVTITVTAGTDMSTITTKITGSGKFQIPQGNFVGHGVTIEAALGLLDSNAGEITPEQAKLLLEYIGCLLAENYRGHGSEEYYGEIVFTGTQSDPTYDFYGTRDDEVFSIALGVQELEKVQYDTTTGEYYVDENDPFWPVSSKVTYVGFGGKDIFHIEKYSYEDLQGNTASYYTTDTGLISFVPFTDSNTQYVYLEHHSTFEDFTFGDVLEIEWLTDLSNIAVSAADFTIVDTGVNSGELTFVSDAAAVKYGFVSAEDSLFGFTIDQGTTYDRVIKLGNYVGKNLKVDVVDNNTLAFSYLETPKSYSKGHTKKASQNSKKVEEFVIEVEGIYYEDGTEIKASEVTQTTISITVSNSSSGATDLADLGRIVDSTGKEFNDGDTITYDEWKTLKFILARTEKGTIAHDGEVTFTFSGLIAEAGSSIVVDDSFIIEIVPPEFEDFDSDKAESHVSAIFTRIKDNYKSTGSKHTSQGSAGSQDKLVQRILEEMIYFDHETGDLVIDLPVGGKKPVGLLAVDQLVNIIIEEFSHADDDGVVDYIIEKPDNFDALLTNLIDGRGDYIQGETVEFTVKVYDKSLPEGSLRDDNAYYTNVRVNIRSVDYHNSRHDYTDVTGVMLTDAELEAVLIQARELMVMGIRDHNDGDVFDLAAIQTLLNTNITIENMHTIVVKVPVAGRADNEFFEPYLIDNIKAFVDSYVLGSYDVTGAGELTIAQNSTGYIDTDGNYILGGIQSYTVSYPGHASYNIRIDIEEYNEQNYKLLSEYFGLFEAGYDGHYGYDDEHNNYVSKMVTGAELQEGLDQIDDYLSEKVDYYMPPETTSEKKQQIANAFKGLLSVENDTLVMSLPIAGIIEDDTDFEDGLIDALYSLIPSSDADITTEPSYTHSVRVIKDGNFLDSDNKYINGASITFILHQDFYEDDLQDIYLNIEIKIVDHDATVYNLINELLTAKDNTVTTQNGESHFANDQDSSIDITETDIDTIGTYEVSFTGEDENILVVDVAPEASWTM